MAEQRRRLLIDRRSGQSLIVGDLEVVVVGVREGRVRLGIQVCEPVHAAHNHGGSVLNPAALTPRTAGPAPRPTRSQ